MRLRFTSSAITALMVLSACTAAAPLESGGQAPQPGGAGGTDASDDGAGTGGVSGGNVAGDGDDDGAAGDAAIMGISGTGAGGMNGAPIAGTSSSAGQGGQGGQGGGVMHVSFPSCEVTDAFDPLIARDGETCYELHVHDGDGVSPFIVPIEGSLTRFYYDIPWPAGTVATRFGADFDNPQVLISWRAFELESNAPNGPTLPNVVGPSLPREAKVIAGWAAGGCNVELPGDVGLELADPGGTKKLMVQFHHYNVTGVPQPDASRVQICTVPRAERPNIAAITRLGTESFGSGDGIPSGVESKFSGTCLNETEEPIHIFHVWPHMHEIGTNMYSEILRSDGSLDVVFDKPFDFDYQYSYEIFPHIVLAPGDKIRSECTYFNSTAEPVRYGQSTKQEVCDQYVYAYPSGALDKPGLPSLLGTTNSCWGD